MWLGSHGYQGLGCGLRCGFLKKRYEDTRWSWGAGRGKVEKHQKAELTPRGHRTSASKIKER